MGVVVSRYDVFLINLDPTVGSENKKSRPCLVVSPNEMNRVIRTVIVAPMTTAQRAYPSRVNLVFRKKAGQVALDQIRTVDRSRLIKKLGSISPKTRTKVHNVLAELLAP